MNSRRYRSPLLVAISLCAVSIFCVAASPADKANSAAPAPPPPAASVTMIPGPLSSFLRLAAISQKASPEEVLPHLAHNVALQGYRGWQERSADPTEFLILLRRYVQQARELMALAGPEGVIRVSDCEQAKPLLTILGYRLRQSCENPALETAEADRAFLTLDSAFPLATLEESLRTNKPFSYPYTASRVPVLFTQDAWTGDNKTWKNYRKDDDVVDVLLRDPGLARVYWALARMDDDTANLLRQSPGLQKLIPYAAVLDYYGSYISVRAGKVVVPGGAAAEGAWKDLVGASPSNPAEFITNLLSKDDGWPAAYYDVLSRVSHSQQAYFTDGHRLRRFYDALCGHNPAPGPARPVLRPNPGLLLLVSRLQVDANGQPRVPGNVEVWKEILHHKAESSVGRDWAKRAAGFKNPEQVVEAMFGLSRGGLQGGSLQAYLVLSEIDRGRAPEQRLSPQVVRLLVDKFARFGSQYSIFSEFHTLNNASIARFLVVAESLDRMPNQMVRANALGIFQANVGLWQILARQGQISNQGLNNSWQRVIDPFAGIHSPTQLYDAGRTALAELLRAATGTEELSQDEIIAVLAGHHQANAEDERVRQELAGRMRSVLENQRLVSLDTLLALGDGMTKMAEGKVTADSLMPLARELREFEMPRTMFTNSERNEWSIGLPDNRHTSSQLRTDLTKVIKANSPKQLVDARGQLAPFLRDSLVGLNYAYYEPPGAQMLHNNALFVRSHDFSGSMTMAGEQSWQAPRLFGSGLAAARGARLVGSLADLPYVLAKGEQDFIVPENVQALIWDELVPTLVASSVVPRWWGITRNELHAVTLYQRTGEELLAAAAQDENVRRQVMEIVSDRMLPQRAARVEKALSGGHGEDLPDITPAEAFYLAAEYRTRYAKEKQSWGPAGGELDRIVRIYPKEVGVERLSEDFGVPHPALAQSYACELLDVKPFPLVMDYGSRLLAESWDSNNLYWARLADELGYPPSMLNRLVPKLTMRMVEKIFASDLEDWPALVRAMRETAADFRAGKIEPLPGASPTARK